MNSMLYLECENGISGDMAVAALLDLGASREKLDAALASLPVRGFQTRISRVNKAGLDCCDFAVLLDAVHENHDHDMAYLHGNHGEGAHAARAHENEECAGDSLSHGHEHAHAGKHAAGHAHAHQGEVLSDDACSCASESPRVHAHEHEHRGLSDVKRIINAAAMTQGAKDVALRTFDILAEAEAKAHGLPKDKVHFHEVGAVDSIVDIVAAAVCFDDLGIADAAVTHLAEGCGTVRCQHGVLPVPVPAVVNITSAAHIPLAITDCQGELVTPTGAAFAAAVRTRSALPAHFLIERVGLGAGKRSYARPSVVRAMLIKELPADPGDDAHPVTLSLAGQGALPVVWKLETEVDDCPGEALGFTLERLFAAGAREAHYAPVFMKKNRPGWQIQVLCAEADISALEQVLFEDTTTIGIRRTPMQRTTLPREIATVRTPYGEVRGKRVVLPNGVVRTYPEYEDVARIARERGLAYQEVYRRVLADMGGE